MTGLIDQILDRSVVGGFSSIGYSIRRRLPSWPADAAPNSLQGKTALVTGASSGLGISTAAGLGQLRAKVLLVVRDVRKGEQVAQTLRHSIDAEFEVVRCDLADLNDVRRFSAHLSEPRIDVLIHNAGALPPTRQESAQGHELTMALHVLAPVLMTELLAEKLTPAARIVFVTSGGMYSQRLRADDPGFLDGEYSGTTAYARSKRAQIELMPILTQRWAPARVYATHPGWADTPGVKESIPAFEKLTRPILRDAESGSDTTVWLSATEPAPAPATLWHDRVARPTHFMARTRTGDLERRRMWNWVQEQLVELREPHPDV